MIHRVAQEPATWQAAFRKDYIFNHIHTHEYAGTDRYLGTALDVNLANRNID